jgi:DnaJ-class molecular chaperone
MINKTKPGYIYDVCPDCKGQGIVPAKGIPEGATGFERDIKALFPSVCEGCGGGGKKFVKIEGS